MMLLKAIEEDKSLEARAKAGAGLVVQYTTASIVVRPTTKGIAQHMAKSARSVAVITTSKLYVKMVQITMKAVPKEIKVNKDSKKGKGKKFDEVSKDNEGVMDDLTEQVQSLFYNDIRFNAINTRMHKIQPK